MSNPAPETQESPQGVGGGMSTPMTSALIGALLGGGGSYLAHQLRKKDEDEDPRRKYTQALVGALLGGAAGYGGAKMWSWMPDRIKGVDAKAEGVDAKAEGVDAKAEGASAAGQTPKPTEKKVPTQEEAEAATNSAMSIEMANRLNKWVLPGIVQPEEATLGTKLLVDESGEPLVRPRWANLGDVGDIIYENPLTTIGAGWTARDALKVPSYLRARRTGLKDDQLLAVSEILNKTNGTGQRTAAGINKFLHQHTQPQINFKSGAKPGPRNRQINRAARRWRRRADFKSSVPTKGMSIPRALAPLVIMRALDAGLDQAAPPKSDSFFADPFQQLSIKCLYSRPS
jgi:hypothetical protein